jgi:hypothetical protein
MADRLAPITGRLDRLSAALAPSSAAARTMADTVQAPVEAELELAARDAFGSDLRPFRREPIVAGVQFEDRASTGHVRMTFKLRPVRAWVFGEKGARPHIIGDQAGYVKAARAQHPVRGPVQHPGARGRRAITRARERVTRAARPAVVDGLRNIVKDTARG